MTIVCGVDFSPAAARATKVAGQLARRLGDRLTLVHAVEPITPVPLEFGGEFGRAEKSLRDAGARLLGEAAAELRGAGFDVEEVVADGHPDQVLLAEGQARGARLIVLGTYGRRGPARWIAGSVAQRVVGAADRPVVVVPETGPDLEPWARGARPLTIAVGVDRSLSSLAALDWVRALRAVGPCNVVALHFYWPPQEYTRLGLSGPLFAGNPQVIDVLEHEVRGLIGELPGEGSLSVRVVPHWGELGDALQSRGVYEGADLVVVGTHQRHGVDRVLHGSVAAGALRAARLPLLCVPAPLHHEEPHVPRLERVLVATDLSPLGDQAVPWAYAAVDPGGHVELCHVFEHYVPHPIYAYASDKDALRPEHRAELEQRLAALIPPEAKARHIVTHVNVIDGGRAGEALAQAAERLMVDAICIATHGRSGLGKALLGSVAEEVMRRSKRPVLLLRGPRFD